MLPRIFVGGTGRSGTWILYKILGCHRAIHTFPAEIRFLIDSGGLVELLDALTIRYSPNQAREALFQFERLMRVYLATPGENPYAALDLPSWLGNEYYWQQLDKFCSALVEVEYEGYSWDIEKKDEGRLVAGAKKLRDQKRRLEGRNLPANSTPPRERLKEGKYFSDRRQLVSLIATFVDSLFLQAAHENGKLTWCEKTPQHFLYLDFLWELFPDSVFIHVKRDPRGVIHSLTKQPWAPNDIKEACLFLKGSYSRWFDLKEKIDFEKYSYLEFKLEDFALSPHPLLEEITSLCGIENHFDNIPDLNIDKVSYWKKTMAPEEFRLVNDVLGSHIEQMGYEL